MRFDFDPRKSRRLRSNPRRGIGFEEAQEIFSHPFISISGSKFRSSSVQLGGLLGKLYTLIFEVREDREGEYYHLVTLWKATRQEQQLYEEHS